MVSEHTTYCLINLFSLFGSLTFIIILRGFFEQLKRQIGLDMANSYASSLHTEVRTKSYFFLQKPLKTGVNLKYQSKGSSYILHYQLLQKLDFFINFYGKEKRETEEKRAGCGTLAKRGRECGIRTPLPDPILNLLASFFQSSTF